MKKSNMSSFIEALEIHKLIHWLTIKSFTAAFPFLVKAINFKVVKKCPSKITLPYSPAYCHKHKILKH